MGTEVGLLATRVEIDFRRDGTGRAHGIAHGYAHHALYRCVPCALASLQSPGPWPCTPGGFTGKPVTVCLGRARALLSTLALALAENIGIIHQHRCCSPAASTDMAVVLRPQHWKQIRSKRPDGRPSSSIPSQNSQGPPFARCDAVKTPSAPYLVTVPTLSVFSARASTEVPTPHTHTHTPPSFGKAAKHCHLHHPPCTLSCTPYPPPCSGAGGGGRVGSINYAVPRYTVMCYHTPQYLVACVWVRTVHYTIDGPASQVPPFASDTTAATRITAWPQRQPHQGCERFRSSRC